MNLRLSTTFAHDGRNRLLSTTDPFGKIERYTYDGNENLLTRSLHPLLLDPQAFDYDAVGNRTSGGSVVNSENQLTADTNHTYQYDDNGNLIRKTLLATGNYTQYSYDAENRLTQVQEFAAGNPTAITISSYRYDSLGRRIEKVANGQTTRYIYDGEDILLEYNGSNVLQARYTHGPGIDEPLSRTPMVPGLGSGQTAVLASTPDGLRGPVVDDGIKVNGQVSVGFVFVSGMPAPAIGQPIDSTGLEQPIAPIDVTAAAATGILAVDLIDTGGIGGNAPLYLVTRDQATNQVLESRLLFPARATFASTTPLGTPLVVASATVPTTTPVADGTLYYHQDGLGTVTELTDVNGSVAKAYAYDAYGNILESPGMVEQPYTYTGREFDSESGLYYYRERYFDPSIGRFIHADPLGQLAGVNLYAYVKNNPANFKDPLGLIAPPSPPGEDICEDIRTIRNMGWWDIIANFSEGGKWDTKRLSSKYEAYGNYHFSVLMRARGTSAGLALRGAGSYQLFGDLLKGYGWHNGEGWPWGDSPYGDYREDQLWIREGMIDFDGGYFVHQCPNECPLPK